MFDKAKQLMKLRGIQQELKKTTVGAERLDGKIKIVMSGDFKPQEIHIDDELLNPEESFKLEKALKETFNEALSKAQSVAAAKMKEMGAGLDIPGM